MAGHRPIEAGIFEVEGQEQCVTLYKHQVTWCPRNNGSDDLSELVTLKLRDVLQVKISCKEGDVNQNRLSPGCCVIKESKEKSWESLLICFAQEKRNTGNWKTKSIQFFHAELQVLNHWLKMLQNCIDGLSHRPKNLLFFVNPFGGKRKALKIFENKVKPVLETCSVKWTTIHTQRRNHATDTLLNMTDEKLKEYDVVVAVGGDGTVCEVVTGLLMRGAENTSVADDLKLNPAVIPIAVIPAGSSNALAVTLHGTEDVMTATIHLVLGGSVPLDVAAIQNHEGIARFIVGQMSYGHLADTLLHSEDLRWMGPKRYDWAGFRKFVGHATYQGSVDMKVSLDDLKKPPSVCNAGNGCEECFNSGEEKDKNTEWRRVEGQFLSISGANVSCRCALSPHGMAPFAHLSDGMLDLILVKKASRLSHLRYLLRTAGDSRRAFALPFVERYRVKEFIFTPVQCCPQQSSGEVIPNGPFMDPGSSNSIAQCGCDTRKQEKGHSVWNCDGELVMQPSVRVTVHKNLVNIMARHTPDSRLQMTY